MTYTDRIRAALIAGSIQPGEVTHVEVEHQRQCPANAKGVRRCSCTPVVRVLRDHEVLTIGADGHVIERRGKA